MTQYALMLNYPMDDPLFADRDAENLLIAALTLPGETCNFLELEGSGAGFGIRDLELWMPPEFDWDCYFADGESWGATDARVHHTLLVLNTFGFVSEDDGELGVSRRFWTTELDDPDLYDEDDYNEAGDLDSED